MSKYSLNALHIALLASALPKGPQHERWEAQCPLRGTKNVRTAKGAPSMSKQITEKKKERNYKQR